MSPDGATSPKGATDDTGVPRGGQLRLDAVVVGRVQGVGFRFWVQDAARSLGLAGWVANQPDGSVRCVAEGRAPELDQLLLALHEGPPASRVDEVSELRMPATGEFDGFRIRSLAHGGD